MSVIVFLFNAADLCDYYCICLGLTCSRNVTGHSSALIAWGYLSDFLVLNGEGGASGTWPRTNYALKGGV